MQQVLDATPEQQLLYIKAWLMTARLSSRGESPVPRATNICDSSKTACLNYFITRGPHLLFFLIFCKLRHITLSGVWNLQISPQRANKIWEGDSARVQGGWGVRGLQLKRGPLVDALWRFTEVAVNHIEAKLQRH